MQGLSCDPPATCCYLLNGVQNPIHARNSAGDRVGSSDSIKLLKDVIPGVSVVNSITDCKKMRCTGRLLAEVYQTCFTLDPSSITQVAERLSVCPYVGTFMREDKGVATREGAP